MKVEVYMRSDSTLGVRAVAGTGVAVMRYHIVDRISLASVAMRGEAPA